MYFVTFFTVCIIPIIRGNRRNTKAGTLVLRRIETSCSNSSFHEESALPYWDKNGSSSPLTGGRGTDVVHAMSFTLSEPKPSHADLTAAGAMRLMAYHDGREIASNNPFRTVRIHVIEGINICFNLQLKQLHQYRVRLAVLSTAAVTGTNYGLVVHVYEDLRSSQPPRPGGPYRTAAGGGGGRTFPPCRYYLTSYLPI